MRKQTLFVFQFKTGDASCSYLDIPVIIKNNCTIEDYCAIELRFQGLLEKYANKDYEFEDIVESTMKSLRFSWEFATQEAACPRLYVVRAS